MNDAPPSGSAVIRIFLADDHAIVRDGLRALLDAQPDLRVIGEAADGREAVRLALELKPDVAIMDITMPELNGIEAAGLVRAGSPATQVVILSAHASAEHIVRALQAGARGYLWKESAGRELVTAVHAVHAGRRYVSEKIAETVLDDYLQLKTGQLRSPLGSLSQREREVLELVAAGHSSADVGRRLSLSPKTVDTYRSRLMHKLGVPDVTALIKFAVENGLTPDH